MTEYDPRYPIGRVSAPVSLTAERRDELVTVLGETPGQLRTAVADMNDTDWDLTYRDGGWTIRQVVHHLADSHLNCAIRFRLALTETTPIIKTYDESAWASLPDVFITPPEVSIVLLEAIHRRWVDLLRAIPPESFALGVFHPEHQTTVTLDRLLGIYAWHGEHHIAHIRQALGRRGSPMDGGSDDR